MPDAIEPFHLAIPQAQLVELRRRLADVRGRRKTCSAWTRCWTTSCCIGCRTRLRHRRDCIGKASRMRRWPGTSIFPLASASSRATRRGRREPGPSATSVGSSTGTSWTAARISRLGNSRSCSCGRWQPASTPCGDASSCLRRHRWVVRTTTVCFAGNLSAVVGRERTIGCGVAGARSGHGCAIRFLLISTHAGFATYVGLQPAYPG